MLVADSENNPILEALVFNQASVVCLCRLSTLKKEYEIISIFYEIVKKPLQVLFYHKKNYVLQSLHA